MAPRFVYGVQRRGANARTKRGNRRGVGGVARKVEQKSQPGAEPKLQSAINEQLISMQYSDFTLVCKDRRYSLHKVIVCARSKVFATMLGSQFREGLENTIDLSEQDADAVHFMIRYIYGFDALVDDEKDEDAGTRVRVHPLVLHIKLYILADCYDIQGLKDEALRNFNAAKKTAWDAKAFVKAASLAYNETQKRDVDLRKSIVDGFMEHLNIMHDDALRSSLEDANGLMWFDVAQSLARAYKPPGSRYY